MAKKAKKISLNRRFSTNVGITILATIVLFFSVLFVAFYNKPNEGQSVLADAISPTPSTTISPSITQDTDNLLKVIPNTINADGTVSSVISSDGEAETTTANKPQGCTPVGKLCYYWVGARQTNFTATGATVFVDVAAPTVGKKDDHSISELLVGTSDRKSMIEEGWYTVPKSHPILFVYHWVNGKGTCYNGCGFVKVKTPISVGTSLKIKTKPRLSIEHVKDRWNVAYNGHIIGYFPDSLWKKTSFTSFDYVDIFGEVGASGTQKTQTQMGNGKLGTNASSIAFNDLHLINSKAQINLLPNYYQPTIKQIYDYGQKKANGFHFGGPGY